MKFTMSKDGRRRADMRVAVRVGRDELIATLCYAVSQQFMDPDAVRTRNGVWEITREIYRTRGVETTYFWADDIDETEESEISEWAQTTVDALFPELREE